MSLRHRGADPPIADLRRARRENQTTFLARFGAMQSAGGRYERERSLPAAVRILVCLFLTRDIDEEKLVPAAVLACVQAVLAKNSQ